MDLNIKYNKLYIHNNIRYLLPTCFFEWHDNIEERAFILDSILSAYNNNNNNNN